METERKKRVYTRRKKMIKREQMHFKLPSDIVEFMRSRPEKNTHMIVAAMREKYNLPWPI